MRAVKMDTNTNGQRDKISTEGSVNITTYQYAARSPTIFTLMTESQIFAHILFNLRSNLPQ